MKIGDNVWISWQDIEACGYGDSVNTCGKIDSEEINGGYYVVYKPDYYPYDEIRKKFYTHNLHKED